MEKNLFKTGQEKKEKVKISKERGEIIGKVSYLAYSTGNELKFYDFGDENLEKSTENIQIKPEVFEGLQQEDVETIKNSLRLFKQYICGAIFTDQYKKHRNFNDSKDKETRVGWENANIYGDNLTKKELDYYKSNRINLGSRVVSTLGYLQVVSLIIQNKQIQDKILNLEKKVPEELKDAVKYENLSNEERVEKVKEFSKIIAEAINILENKEK
jgi:hypothetical protein